MNVLLAMFLLVAILSVGTLARSAWEHRVRQRRRRAAYVMRRALVAERRVNQSYQEARRAMNEAAGQGWRNRFE